MLKQNRCLKIKKSMLRTEPDGLTAMMVGLITTQTGQTATRRSQTAAQAGPTTRTQGAVAPRSWNRDVVKKIGGSQFRCL
jgi:hypothetical protein